MGGRAGSGAVPNFFRSIGLQQSLKKFEKEIRHNNFETLIVLDENGKSVLRIKGAAHEVKYGKNGPKTKDRIVTHNHPGGASFSK